MQYTTECPQSTVNYNNMAAVYANCAKLYVSILLFF